MPSITLDIQSAKLTSKFGRDYGVDGDGKWALTCNVKLLWPERLELGTGESLGAAGKPDEIALSLTFRDTTPELVEWATERTKGVEDASRNDDDTVCGVVSYHAEQTSRDGLDGTPAAILFNLYTPPDVMASLVRFAENGRFVKRVTVELRGMEYGWEPDGRTKKWPDNSEQKMLPIANVRYELPLLDVPDSDTASGETTPPGGPDLATLLREAVKLQKWALYALAIIAGALVFKGWR